MTETISLTPQMMVVLGLLGVTIVLFAFEILRIDLAALSVMVLLGLLSVVPGLEGISDPRHLFDGFASNAVISIIGVMIIGAGLDKTGIMSRVAGFILRVGGSTEKRIVPILTGSVGFLSGFLQNTGAVAVFVPVAARISARTGIPMSRLLIPLSFCAIMGGTLTLVGTSSTILLNDLLPEDIEPFGLFEQTPIGIALLAAGIIYFVLAGRFVLPSIRREGEEGEDTMAYFRRVYGLSYKVRAMKIPAGSALDGKLVSEVESTGKVRVIATHKGGDLRIRPTRDQVLSSGMELALMGRTEQDLEYFAEEAGVEVCAELGIFIEALASTNAGISEVVIPPDSSLIGKTCQDVWMRRTHGLSVLAIHRGGETMSEMVRTVPLQAGDMLVAYTTWDALARLEKNRDFVVVTRKYPHEELRPHKVQFAALFFAIAIGLVLFTEVRLSLCFLVGAVGMILTGVLSMDEAYHSVSWKTVFLLACLIPLGAAVQDSGTAAWIAQEALRILGHVPVWVLQSAVAVLATFFTLVMSNVGAAVLLVPMAIGIATTAQAAGLDADPRVFALTVGIAASNSFVLPTHQCNALVMGPGGYRVKDFVKAGGIMTVIFLVVSLVMLNVVF
ncbi:MAG: SLC13 family permease [Chloroflexi bacterium]|nr:SLC13 family permease [Chloroflexota bacterium]